MRDARIAACQGVARSGCRSQRARPQTLAWHDDHVRHLTEQQALAALKRRAPIEQMLSKDLDSGAFSWLAARPSGQVYTLRLQHTLDDGTKVYFDVYEFRSVDEDDDLGEGTLVGEYPDGASLLKAAAEFGATSDRWVNEWIIQDEYRDLRNHR
jgi:hypothetical protein